MSLKTDASCATGIDQLNIPNRFQILGLILLIKLPDVKTEKEKQTLAQFLLKRFPKIKTVCEIKQIAGELRTPVVRKLAGNGTETVHKEHRISYKLDVARIMFSKGNHAERKRLFSQDMNNETVIDMFAGIGYFSLACAKYGNAKKIIAIEKNEDAFHYLQENIKINTISTIEPVLGDCRTFAEQHTGVADRVFMGYFPHTELFLPAAINMLKSRGTIHFHNTYADHELWSVPEKQLDDLACTLNFSYKILAQKIVKSTAPHVKHVVMDIAIKK